MGNSKNMLEKMLEEVIKRLSELNKFSILVAVTAKV